MIRPYFPLMKNCICTFTLLHYTLKGNNATATYISTATIFIEY